MENRFDVVHLITISPTILGLVSYPWIVSYRLRIDFISGSYWVLSAFYAFRCGRIGLQLAGVKSGPDSVTGFTVKEVRVECMKLRKPHDRLMYLEILDSWIRVIRLLEG